MPLEIMGSVGESSSVTAGAGDVSTASTSGAMSDNAATGGSAGRAPLPLEEHSGRTQFTFTGTTAEYFRIWIVNVALSVLTLGVYSAWAKVRTKQYFYGHAHLHGSSFEYLADPLTILKGRLVVAGFLALLFVSQYYSLALYVGLMLLVLVATPFLIVQGMRFHAHNSAFRNVRFGFTGKVGELYALFAKMGLLTLVTLGLGYPYAQWRVARFVLANHQYGNRTFAWYAKPKDYYMIVLRAFLLQAGAALLIVMLLAVSGGDFVKSPVLTMLAGGAFYGIAALGFAYTQAALNNLMYNQLVVGWHRFESSLETLGLLKLYAINSLAIAMSLGLLIPWAKIRVARYRADRLAFLGSAAVLVEADSRLEAGRPVGDAAGDLGDVGFEMGI